MENALIPIADIERMGQSIAKSGLFGMKTAEQAIALMLIAQAEGMHPAIAARDYHIIQGRPALKADTMLARFQAAGGKVSWKSYTDSVCEATFSHPQGGEISIKWTMEQAKKIGLAAKDNWAKYPRAMLRARVISEGIRTVYPGVIAGTYTPEEIQDMEPVKEEKRPPIETTAEVIPIPAPTPSPAPAPKQESDLPWEDTPPPPDEVPPEERGDVPVLKGKVVNINRLAGKSSRGPWTLCKYALDIGEVIGTFDTKIQAEIKNGCSYEFTYSVNNKGNKEIETYKAI